MYPCLDLTSDSAPSIHSTFIGTRNRPQNYMFQSLNFYFIFIIVCCSTAVVQLASATVIFNVSHSYEGGFSIVYIGLANMPATRWAQASADCASRGDGWSLATIRDANAQAKLAAVNRTAPSWIGAAEEDQGTGIWFWPFGRLSTSADTNATLNRIFYNVTSATVATLYYQHPDNGTAYTYQYSNLNLATVNGAVHYAALDSASPYQWSVKAAVATMTSWICEYSPCTVSGDCEAANTISAIGNWPNCLCRCASYASGERCEIVTVNHGSYSSDLQVVCGPTDQYWNYERCDTANGWVYGTIGSAAANTLLVPMMHGHTWISAMNTDSANSRWQSGRLNNKPFNTGRWPGTRTCNSFLPAGLVMAGSSMQFCNWGGYEPSNAGTGAQIAALYPTFQWDDLDGTTPMPCRLCERTPCDLALDCVGGSVAVTGYYPTCVCVAARACTTADCILTGTLSASGSYPSCTCSCKDGYYGTKCEYFSQNHGPYVSEYTRSCPSFGSIRWPLAKLLCRAMGDGWNLATIPTAETEAKIAAQSVVFRPWFGGGNNEPSAASGTAKWLFGRLNGQPFSSGLAPSPTGVNVSVFVGSYALTPAYSFPIFSNWRPASPTLQSNFRMQYTDLAWLDSGLSAKAPCYVCERQPCNITLDCYEPNTNSVTGYYPDCNCSCFSVSSSINSRCTTETMSLSSSISETVTATLTNTETVSLSSSISETVTATLTNIVSLTDSPSITNSLTDTLTSLLTNSATSIISSTLTETISYTMSEKSAPTVSDALSLSRILIITTSNTATISLSETPSVTIPKSATLSESSTGFATGTSSGFNSATVSELESHSISQRVSATLSPQVSANTQSPAGTSSVPILETETPSKEISGTLTEIVLETLTEIAPNTLTKSASQIVESETVHLDRALTASTSPTQTKSESPAQTLSEKTKSASPTQTKSESYTPSKTPVKPTTLAPTTVRPNGTAPTTTSTTRTPIVVIPATLSNEGYGYRYVQYNASAYPPLYGLYSGLNLLLTQTYKDWQARRFLFSASGNGQVRLPLDNEATVGTGPSFSAVLALSKTAREVDWVTLNGAMQTSFVDITNHELTIPGIGASLICGDLITGASEFSSTLASSVQVKVGPLAQLPHCRSSISYSGIAYSNTAFNRAAVLSYAHLPANSSDATTSAFLSGTWRGSLNDTFRLLSDLADSILIGSVTNPTSTPASAVQQRIRLLRPTSLSQPVRISELTHNSVACTIADQRAFRVTSIGTNVSNTLVQRLGANPSSCYTFDTVDDLHLACQLSATCAGFTSILMYTPLPREMPLCIYLTGSSAAVTDVMPYARVFYSKPQLASTPSCEASIERSGRVAVYVQQTSMASSSVVVRVNGRVAAQCGGSSPFANGFLGVDGRCGQWALCYAGSVPTASNVSVTPSARLDQGGCDNSLGVLISQTSVDNIQVTATTLAPLRRLDVSGLASRTVRKSENDDAIKLFIYSGWAGALDVVQTGYGCTAGGNCDSPVVGLSTATSCQSCGGANGFLDGRAGTSDECDSSQFCGDFMPLQGQLTSAGCGNNSRGTPIGAFTGFASVTANVSLLYSQLAGGGCSGFLGQVYASRPSGNTSQVPVFPLVSSIGLFATLHGRSLAAGSSTYNSSAPAGSVRLMTLLPLTEQLEVSYVPSWTNGSIQATLGRNSTQVCIVDHSQELSASCTFYIPIGATHLTVRAAQTDFATKAMQVQVLLDGLTVSATDTCGGSSNRFSKVAGQQERCDTFSTCSNQFLYSNDSDSDQNSAGVVVVTLPALLRSYTCGYQAAIIADFTRPNVASVLCNTTTEFECSGERKCIPKEYVCDGIQDCDSEADEQKCSQLVTLPNEIFCVGESQQFITQVSSLAVCTRIALANGSSIFWFNGSHCTVVIPDLTSSLLADPAGFVCPFPADRTITYLSLTDRSSFGLCRSSIQCFGNGMAAVGEGGVCSCTCSDGFTGTSCGSSLKLDYITNVACLLEDASDTTTVSMALVAEALRLQSKVVTVACTSISREQQGASTLLRVMCAVTSTRSSALDVSTHYRRLLRSSIWPTLNATLLSSGQPMLRYITGKTTMTQEVAMPPCSVSVEGQQASCLVQVAHDGVRLTVSSNLSALSATVTITEPGTSSRRSFATSATCSMAATTGSGGCIKSACDIGVKGSANATITVTNVVYAPATLLTSECSAPDIGIAAQIAYGNLATTTNITVVNEVKDYKPFLISGIVIFIVGALAAWVVAVATTVKFMRQQHDVLTKHLGGLRLRPYLRLKAEMLARLRLLVDVKASGSVRWDRCASVFAVLGSVLAICASFLIIYYRTAHSTNSNFSVMYEEYSDEYCDASAIGYMPRRIFAVPPGTTSCEKMQSTGESVGVSFASGECEGTDGDYTVTFRLGSSKNGCREAPELTFASGVCVPVSKVDAGSTRSVYVQLTCSSATQVAQRVQQLQALTSDEDVFESGELLEPSSRLDPPQALNAADDSGPFYRTPYLDGLALASSTSHLANVLVSQSDPSEFDGDFDGQRIVLQSLHCTYSDTASATCSSFLEASLQSGMRTLSAGDIRELAPHVTDVPFGQLFGGFGTSEPVTWAGAGPTAHRYYSVAGGLFDMGTHFPSDRSAPSDSEGYSVSMWLRADSTSLGFAYAVTDAFEDDQAATVLTLERLASIIDSGSGGHSWFATTYRVYHSLYVNGPGKSLTFAYASPDLEDRVVELDFDLIEIGAAQVMNGQWHHVAVTFLVENSKIRAQLVVDGQSSYTKAGWSACVDSPPEAINRRPSFGNGSLVDTNGDGVSSAGAPVFDHVADRVTSGGLLVVGYFNGGVFGLQASAEPMLNTDFLATGTQLMKDSNSFPRQGTLGLGASLLALAGVLLVYMVVTSVADVRGLMSSSSEEEYRQALEAFYGAQKQLTTPLISPKEVALMHAPSPNSNQNTKNESFMPIRFATAMRWLSMDVHALSAVMAELVAQSSNPAETLLMMLLTAKRGEPTPFSVVEWNAMALQETEVQTFADEDLELARCGRQDLYLKHFKGAKAVPEDGVNVDARSKYASRADYSDTETDNADIEMKGDMEGVGEARNLKLPGATSGTSSASAPSVSFPPVASLFGPMIGVFQGMHVWATSIELPRFYNGYFTSVFAFFSIDFAAAFPSVPSLITPIVQVAVGLSVLAVVVYLLIDDDRRFYTQMTKYVWRRDSLEAKDAGVDERVPCELLAALTANDPLPSGECEIPALPIRAGHQLDLFNDVAKARDGDPVDYQTLKTITVSTSDGVDLLVSRAGEGKKGGQLETADGELITTIGAHCGHHPSVLLTAVGQNAVWPCTNRARCCVKGCGRETGVLFSCGHAFLAEDGEPTVCVFALCQTHHQLPVTEHLLMVVATKLRFLRASGFMWLLCTLALVLADAAYTPFMKTALMIVGCHPYYQCEFPECWAHIDQKFALAVFLAFTVIGFLGVGLPTALFVLLRRRRAMMEESFLDPEHKSKYTDKATGTLKLSEWCLFVGCDTSALAEKYKDLNPRWLFFPSLMVVLKVATLIPSIFLEPRSLDQRIGCAAVQAATTLLIFGTKAYFSPIMLLTLRTAELHQLIQLGLQSIDLVVRNDTNGTSVSTVMVAVTLFYVIFTFIVAASTIGWPVIEEKVRDGKLKKLFAQFHLPFSGQTTLYKEPAHMTDNSRIHVTASVIGHAASGAAVGRSTDSINHNHPMFKKEDAYSMPVGNSHSMDMVGAFHDHGQEQDDGEVASEGAETVAAPFEFDEHVPLPPNTNAIYDANLKGRPFGRFSSSEAASPAATDCESGNYS